MREIVGKAYTDLGRELTEAQAELAKHGYGCFEAWCATLDFSKRTVTNLINRYETIRQLLPDQKVSFEDLPVTLTYSISAPSAESTPEKAQAKAEVLAGEITTNKAYKERIAELEREKTQAETSAQAERKERERLERETEELSDRLADIPESKEPEIRYETRTEYVEVRDEEITDPHPDKMARATYPIMSDTQRGERIQDEVSIKWAEEIAIDGNDYREKTRLNNRKIRSITNGHLRDKDAHARNKEKRKVYREFTKIQPIKTYRINEI